MPWKIIDGEPKFFIETNVKQTKKWRTETAMSTQPMINGVLRNKLSSHLASIKTKSEGRYTEIFVMDNKV